mmetsp:Transcript_125457/g.401798  ORF Transcript_125457/g.401798 Transcript_125457/m.401798 type:complete len:237 (-) Transcript_125457:89-799(-)
MGRTQPGLIWIRPRIGPRGHPWLRGGGASRGAQPGLLGILACTGRTASRRLGRMPHEGGVRRGGPGDVAPHRQARDLQGAMPKAFLFVGPSRVSIADECVHTEHVARLLRRPLQRITQLRQAQPHALRLPELSAAPPQLLPRRHRRCLGRGAAAAAGLGPAEAGAEARGHIGPGLLATPGTCAAELGKGLRRSLGAQANRHEDLAELTRCTPTAPWHLRQLPSSACPSERRSRCED